MPGFEIAHEDNGGAAAVTPAKPERLAASAANALHCDEPTEPLPGDICAALDAAIMAA